MYLHDLLRLQSSSCTIEEAQSPNIELREPNGSVYPHIALIIAQLIALNLPNWAGRRFVCVIAIVSLVILAQASRFTNDVAIANFAALSWPHYISTLEKLIFSGPQGPEAAFWRSDRNFGEALSFVPFSSAKIKWAITLLINLRGVDWNFEITKNIPRKGWRYTKRSRFLFLQVIEFILIALMADLVAQTSVRAFFTPPSGWKALNSKCITLRDSDLGWSFFKTLIFGLGPYYFINMQYLFCSIIAVALGVSKPKDWPPLFGKLSEVTTVRIFWGSFWQQMLRRSFTSYTQCVVKALGIRRGTNLSSYTQLWLAFFTSGFFHAASILLMPSPINITFRERTTGIMLFFLWQAAAVTTEDFVQYLWKTICGSPKRGSQWPTVVGFCWVILSFWISLPWAGDVLMRVKMGETSPLPFTVAGPFVARFFG